MTFEPSSGSGSQSLNHVVAVGRLDAQRYCGKQISQIGYRNEMHGKAARITLQVPSPFGRTYALPLHYVTSG